MSDLWLQGFVPVVKAFDAAHCPDPVPGGFGACMVYAGGSSATHAWDGVELGRVAHLPRLPVWVPTPGTDNPTTTGLAFVAWCKAHGVPAVNKKGEATRLMWDMETGKEPDPDWLNSAAKVTAAAGFRNITYGSESTLFGQPQRSGYFPANPTGTPHLVQRAHVVGTQWEFDHQVPGGVIDQDVFTADLVRALWLPS